MRSAPHKVTALSRRVAAVLPAVCVAALGCTQRELADQRFNKRVASMENVLAVLEESERTRPEKFQRTLRHAQTTLELQAEQFRRNTRGAAAYIDRDIQRAGERLPAYTRRALEILMGHPERIEGNAIILFY